MLIWLSLEGCTFVTDEEWAGRLQGCELAGQYIDADGDGWGVGAVQTCDQLAASVNRTGDCDDTNGDSYPGATEVLYDGLDADCLGDSDWDKDGDGFDAIVGGGEDCYDNEDQDLPTFEDDCDIARGTFSPADIHPGATDEPYDGVDADCSGGTDFDVDGDGFPKCLECDDADAERYPNVEVEIWYNGFDEDCDGNDGDQDGDGYVVENYAYEPTVEQLRGDCWDAPSDRPPEFVAGNGFVDPAAATVHPSAVEVWYDLVDSDCSRDDDLDQDADGGLVQEYADRDGNFGDDCNDQNAAINAQATESWYDGVDADCLGDSDYDRDADGDNSDLYGGSDCDEADPTVSIFGTEDCASAADDNCDGTANEENAENCSVLFPDNDGDGYGDGASRCLCAPEAAYTSPVGTDCNDGDGAVSPAAAETCATAVDDDCDGDSVELNHPECTDWYLDEDGDGFGGEESVCACLATSFYTVAFGDDCDEASASTFPGSAETCMDGRDGGCDDSPGTCTVSGDGALAEQPFRFEGVGGIGMGSPVSWAGDTDGDGLDEAFVSAPLADEGVVYVLGNVSAAGLADDLAFAVLAGETVGDSFGIAAAGLGDIDGDGFGDIVIGAPRALGTGEAYLFYGPLSDGWRPIHASARLYGDGALDGAGESVARLGDPDADGVGGLVVGAPGNAYNGTGSGMVTLVDGAAAWGSLALSTVMDAAVYGEFSDDGLGTSIAASGDANGDGLVDLLVGAPGRDPGTVDSGAVYLLLAPNTGLQIATSADLTVFGGTDGRQIGRSLAMGDVDGDGIAEVLIGSAFDDTTATDAGAAWGMSGTVVGVQFIDSAGFAIFGSAADERLGTSVAAGDVDNDGRNDLLVGAPGYSSAAGGVHIFTSALTGSTSSTSASARYLGESPGDIAGESVAWLGNADDDALGDFMVGAPEAAAGSGVAYRVRSGGF